MLKKFKNIYLGIMTRSHLVLTKYSNKSDNLLTWTKLDLFGNMSVAWHRNKISLPKSIVLFFNIILSYYNSWFDIQFLIFSIFHIPEVLWLKKNCQQADLLSTRRRAVHFPRRNKSTCFKLILRRAPSWVEDEFLQSRNYVCYIPDNYIEVSDMLIWTLSNIKEDVR